MAADDNFFVYEQATVRAVFGTYLALYLAGVTLLLVVFWRRRALQPIAARVPALVVVTNVFLVILTVMTCMHAFYMDAYPCHLVHYQSAVAMVSVATLYLLRCWILIFNFELTIHLLAQQKAARRAGASFSNLHDIAQLRRESFLSQGTWFMANRHLMDDRNLRTTAAIVFCVFITPSLVVGFAFSPDGKDDNLVCRYPAGNWTLVGTVCVFVLVFVALARAFLRDVVDGFFIQWEMRWTAATVLIGAALWELFVVTDWDSGAVPVHSLVLVLTCLAVTLLSAGLPVLRSYQINASSNETPSSSRADLHELATLNGVLAHPAARRAFKEHLLREFALESIIFWQEVNSLRRSCENPNTTLREKYERALELYLRFVRRGARHEVNLGHGVRTALDEFFAPVVRSRPGLSVEQQHKSIFQTTMPRRSAFRKSSTSRSVLRQEVDVEVVREDDEDEDGGRGGGGAEEMKVVDVSASRRDSASMTIEPLDEHERLAGDVPDEQLRQVPPDLFDAAQNVAFELMERDSFPRFKETPEYAQLVFVRNRSLHRALSSNQGDLIAANKT